MLSNEYQHERVYMVFKDFGVCVLCSKVALALEGLRNLFILEPCAFWSAGVKCLSVISKGNRVLSVCMQEPHMSL